MRRKKVSGGKVMKGQSKSEALEDQSHLPWEEKSFIEKVPIFINVRDRLSCLEKLLKWLERAGHRNIILIDNASTYPPLLNFLGQSTYRTIRLKHNIDQTALWRVKELRSIIANQWFVCTDPDVIPSDICPLNAVAHLYGLLQTFPHYLKAGLGLQLDDIPECYHLKHHVIDWETKLIGEEIAPDVFEADVDTTFALYRPGTPYVIGPSIRVYGKYSAHHLPWYANSSQPDQEEQYYRSHALSYVTTWNVSEHTQSQDTTLPRRVTEQIRSHPDAVLKSILMSPRGRLFSLLAFLRGFSCKRNERRVRKDALTPKQRRQAILDIITSEEWALAWRLSEPLRHLKWRLITIFRR
jgi:hypothetical protein